MTVRHTPTSVAETVRMCELSAESSALSARAAPSLAGRLASDDAEGASRGDVGRIVQLEARDGAAVALARLLAVAACLWNAGNSEAVDEVTSQG